MYSFGDDFRRYQEDIFDFTVLRFGKRGSYSQIQISFWTKGSRLGHSVAPISSALLMRFVDQSWRAAARNRPSSGYRL